MKKIFLPSLFLLFLPALFSCSSTRFAGYRLTEQDAAAAIRQLLHLGVRDASFAGAFSKETVLSTIFPEPVKKTLNTLNALGLTPEIDRFTTTLSTAAEKSAAASSEVFANSIDEMKFADALRIIKAGGVSATDYLRSSSGESLRLALKPIVQDALREYKADQQWEALVKSIPGNKIKPDLSTLMAGAVSELMFRKIEEKERAVRAETAARTTPLLQKVFSRNWNDVGS